MTVYLAAAIEATPGFGGIACVATVRSSAGTAPCVLGRMHGRCAHICCIAGVVRRLAMTVSIKKRCGGAVLTFVVEETARIAEQVVSFVQVDPGACYRS